MARQCGPYYITGQIGNTCWYRMEGKYYVRSKSSLTRKRVMNDPAFALTRKYASLLAAASAIASVVYKELPQRSKGINVYRMITGEAMRMLKASSNAEKTVMKLRQLYLEVADAVSHEAGKRDEEAMAFADKVIEYVLQQTVIQPILFSYVPDRKVPP